MHDSHPPSRRDFLLASSASVALTGMTMGLNAHSKTPPIRLDQYKPEYFTQDEWRFVLAATACLIPSEGDGPGALETHVPVFIDRQLNGEYGSARDWYMQGPHDPTVAADRGWQTPLNPAQLYRQAIAAFNAWCRSRWNGDFASLAPEQQNQAMTALQKGEVRLQPELGIFFSTLLANTKEGYFADPLHGGNHGMKAWSYIGFPGARASFREWVDQHNIAYPLGPVSIQGERA